MCIIQHIQVSHRLIHFHFKWKYRILLPTWRGYQVFTASRLTQYLKCIYYFNVSLDCSFVDSRLRNEDDIFLYILSMFICRCFVHLMFVSHLTSFHSVDVNWWCLIKLNRKSWCFSNIAWHYSCKGKGNCVQFRNLKKKNSHFLNA